MEIRTYDVAMPGAYQVDSAVHHPFGTGISSAEPMRGGGMKSKLQQMKERGLEGWHHVQHSMTDRGERGLERIDGWRRTMTDRSVAMKSSLENRIEELKPVVREKALTLKSDMQTNVPKWAGIAAGAGLVLGIGGRILRHRMHHRRDTYSSLVIIEGAC